ncbi:trypsin-like serine peptidase [Donghicola eburneus]|uniref:Uncharacterized protein n=1 Tax=Donghicola eburneus TaxID=393278 RepID=A0A1M4MYK1_9RHOB|nr:serine protease [Donghicola eburneus]SCM65946.1 hypothetical protein KARMA_0116 [Donghicola eburneus]
MMKRPIEFFLSAILSFILTISAGLSQAGFLGVFAKSDLEKCEVSQSFSELKLGHHQALTGPRQDKNFGQMEPVQNILKGPIRKAANRTGMLRICREGGEVDACTATLLNDHLLLTNAHCLEATQRSGRAIGMYLFLGYEKYADYSDRPRYDVRVEPVEIGSSRDLDYAILELEKPVPNIAPLKASVRDPEAGETMTIVSHALGGIMRVTRGGCVADAGRPLVGLNVLHWCDTRAGSSGALGFADEDRALLFLHSSGDAAEDIRDRGPNQGIRMTALLKQSDILRQMFTPKPADPCEDLNLDLGLSCEVVEGRALVTNNLIVEPIIEAPVVVDERPELVFPILEPEEGVVYGKPVFRSGNNMLNDIENFLRRAEPSIFVPNEPEGSIPEVAFDTVEGGLIDTHSFYVRDLYRKVFESVRSDFRQITLFEPIYEKNPGPQRDIAMTKVIGSEGKVARELIEYPFGYDPFPWRDCVMDKINYCSDGYYGVRDTYVKINVARKIEEVTFEDDFNFFNMLTSDFFERERDVFGFDDIKVVSGQRGFYAIMDHEGAIFIFDANLRVKLFVKIHLRDDYERTKEFSLRAVHLGDLGELYVSVTHEPDYGDANRNLPASGSLYKFNPVFRSDGEMEDYRFSWVSPEKTSNANIAVANDFIITAWGGSNSPDYLYKLDVSTGKVLERTKTPNAAEWLFLDGQTLYVDSYMRADIYDLH